MKVIPLAAESLGVRSMATYIEVGRTGILIDPGATLMVGDSAIDWETARRASARICLARYGFGFHGFPLEQIRAEDAVIDAPADLIRL